jgi:uncharacterized protein
MKVLAQNLYLPYKIKTLKFRKPYYAPLARIAEDVDNLAAPYPDLIICAEALTSVIAQKLKVESGGKINIVSLARPSGDVRQFDLVLSTAQYRLPKLSTVVELMLPITSRPTAMQSAHSNQHSILVLVGASSPPEVLDVDVAAEMVRRLALYAVEKSARLCVVTGPRTTADVAAIFVAGIASPHLVHVWSRDGANPYAQLLADADEIIVTCDSASMLADAIVTQKYVQVYRLPRKFNVKQTCVEWFFKRNSENWIFRSGVIEPSTDRTLLIEKLINAGHVSWFGDIPKQRKPFDPQTDLDVAVAAIKRLGLQHSTRSHE